MDNSPSALLRDSVIIVVAVPLALLVWVAAITHPELALYGLIAAFVLLVAVLVWDTAART